MEGMFFFARNARVPGRRSKQDNDTTRSHHGSSWRPPRGWKKVSVPKRNHPEFQGAEGDLVSKSHLWFCFRRLFGGPLAAYYLKSISSQAVKDSVNMEGRSQVLQGVSLLCVCSTLLILFNSISFQKAGLCSDLPCAGRCLVWGQRFSDHKQRTCDCSSLRVLKKGTPPVALCHSWYLCLHLYFYLVDQHVMLHRCRSSTPAAAFVFQDLHSTAAVHLRVPGSAC